MTAPSSRIFFRNSLVVRSLLSIFLLTSCIISIGAYVVVQKINEETFEHVQEEGTDLAKLLTQILAGPIWNFDKNAVAENLYSLRENHYFCGTRVLDDEDKIFLSQDFRDTTSEDEIIIRLPIVFDNPNDASTEPQKIGMLEACLSSRHAYEENAKIIRFIGLILVAIATGVIGASYFSMRIVFRPLQIFRDAIDNFVENMQPISDPRLTHRNEIGELVANFNIMAVALSETYSSLRRAKDEADAANKAKTDFLANMSHELRTPLNSIIGMTQLLRQSKMDQESQDMFSSISESSDNLLNIVNDILDLSKIEAKEVVLEYTNFDAFFKIRQAVQSLQPMALKKNLKLACEDAQGSFYVLGDPLRYTRILTNLIGNALKYTEEGSVTIKASTQDKYGDQVLLQCEVIDTGIGIPRSRQDKIFEKFTQADSTTTRRFGGTGLGLTITKELVEMMDGKIGLESEPGKGSTFWFEIPFERGIEEEYDPEKARTIETETDVIMAANILASKVRILAAEDHSMNQRFLVKLFKNLGIQNYQIVDNGLKAVHEVESSNYDIVLIDCHMPEMNGYDATESIRGLPDPFKAGIPVIAMTANAMPEDRERCLKAGMNEYISKPIDIEIFKKTLSAWINFDSPAIPETKEESGSADDSFALPIVNFDNLRSVSGGDKEFEAEMIRMFVTQGQEQLDELKALCTGGENEKWSEVAHALKGTAGSVGAEHMKLLCAQAQGMMVADSQERKDKAAEIETQYLRVKNYLIQQNLYSA